MKNLKVLYIALIALVAGAFSACTSDYEPGPQVSGPQVSFVPTNSSLVEYTGDPAEGTQKLVLSRVETKEELTVFINAEAKDNAGHLFSIPEEVTFQAGEATAELVYTIDFANFAQDKTYTVNYLILDELGTLTTPYGYREWTVNYAINPWVLMKDSKGNNAKGKFRGMDLMYLYEEMDPNIEVDVNVYKHNRIEGMYKVENPWKLSVIATFGGEDNVPSYITLNDADFIINCTNPNEVYFDAQKTGVTWDSTWGEIAVLHGSLYDPSFPYGTLSEGVITFPERSCLCFEMNDDKMYYGNPNGLFRLVLPGFEIADYSLAVAYDGMDVASDNVTATAKLNFNYGADVTGIKYLVVSGNVESDPSAALTTLMAGTDENILSVEDFDEKANAVTVKVGLEQGVYTVVAAPQDKDGALRSKTAVVKSFYFPGLGAPEEHPCEVEARLDKYSALYDDNEETDYTTLAMNLKGTDIREITFALFATSDVKEYMDKGGLTMSEFFELAQVGPVSAQTVAKINSAEGVTDYFPGLDADTSYTFLVSATNNYGESKELRIEAETEPVPYSGSLVVGKYYMSCTMGAGTEDETKFENVFTVEPVPGSNTDFLLGKFGIEDNMKWKAAYDETANTLTLSGVANGLENYGPLFGSAYGVYSSAQSLYYGIFSYANENSQYGKDPVVLKVDPTTKQLCGLPTGASIYVYIIQETSTGGQILGSYNAFDDTTTIVPYTEQPESGENGGASTASLMNVKVPFSSVAINKSIVASKSKLQSVKAAGVINSTKASTIRTVKPSVVESCAPAKVKGFTSAKANAAAIRR